MSAPWLDQYLSAIKSRDAREKANAHLLNACISHLPNSAHLPSTKLIHSTDTRLADSHAATAFPPTPTPTGPNPPAPVLPLHQPPPTEALTSLRTDLSTANSSLHALHSTNALLKTRVSALTAQNSTLTTQLAALQSDLASAGTSHSAALSKAVAEKRALERRLRDQEEELAGKAKMVQGVQDEMIALEMEVRVLEGRVEELSKENGRLVERWVERVGWEAEREGKR